MEDDLLNNVYDRIDTLLQSLKNNGSGSLYDLGELYDTEGQLAKNILVENELISFQMGYVTTDSVIDIAPNGLKTLKLGGIKKYLTSLSQPKEEKENLELQQLRTNVRLLTNQVVDYDKTKGYLKYSMITNIILAIVAVVELIFLAKGCK